MLCLALYVSCELSGRRWAHAKCALSSSSSCVAPWVHVSFFTLECVGKVSGYHAEQTQAHRQPQHLDHGNETAQHLESVITPSMRFHVCILLIKQLHCEFA